MRSFPLGKFGVLTVYLICLVCLVNLDGPRLQVGKLTVDNSILGDRSQP